MKSLFGRRKLRQDGTPGKALVRTNPLLERSIYKNDHCTKTGSGHNINMGKAALKRVEKKQRCVFRSICPLWKRSRPRPTGTRWRRYWKRYFLSVFILKWSFCQDRLGTNLGKTQTKYRVSSSGCTTPLWCDLEAFIIKAFYIYDLKVLWFVLKQLAEIIHLQLFNVCI